MKIRHKKAIQQLIIQIGTLVLLLVFFSCNTNSNQTKATTQVEAERDISLAWASFLVALEDRHTATLIDLSLPYILCTECMYRSENYKTDKAKARRIDQYPNAQEFYTQEFNTEFPPEFVTLLKDLEPDFDLIDPAQYPNISPMFKEDLKATDEVWMVILLTTPPGKLEPYHEGGQHIFPFIKTTTGFKFGGITHVP